MVEEKKKNETRQLTLVETFYLYVWTMWKAGAIEEEKVYSILAFCKKLGPSETVDFCFAELNKLSEKYAPPQVVKPEDQATPGEKKDEAVEASGKTSS
jgi:hypothetical protein